MKRVVVLSVLACITASVWAQSPLKRSELSKDFFLTSVEDGNAKLLSKYSGVTLAYHKTRKELLLYGEMENDYIIYLEKIPFSGKFYPQGFKEAYLDSGKIKLCSQVPNKATVLCNVFNWTDETMKFEKETSFDLSQLQTERAEQLIKAGKINEAILTYDSVLYAQSYYDSVEVAVKLLSASYKSAEKLVSRRKFKDAGALIKKVLAFKGWAFLTKLRNGGALQEKFGKSLFGMTSGQFENIIVSYCGYWVDGRAYDEGIAEMKRMGRFFPANTDLLLYHANAWYGKRDKDKASELYKQYTAKMKEKKKQKDIPYYVPQRIRD